MTAEGLAARTIEARVEVVGMISRAAGVDPRALTREHVEQYLAERDLAAWSRRKYVEHCRAWATWAGIADPTEGLTVPRCPRGLPRPVTEAALRRLLLVATGRHRAWVLLGAYCGLRAFESAKVRGDDLVDGDHGPLLRVAGKGGRVDYVDVPAIVLDELLVHRARAGSGRLWPGVTSGAVQHAIRRLGRRAGVKVTSHQLRHRYGTALYRASGDLLLTQRLMRHASPATTAGYALVADEAARRLVDALPGAAPPAAVPA